jgi:hypothetical protein
LTAAGATVLTTRGLSSKIMLCESITLFLDKVVLEGNSGEYLCARIQSDQEAGFSCETHVSMIPHSTMFLAFDDDPPTWKENGILLSTLLEARAGIGIHSHFDVSSQAFVRYWRGRGTLVAASHEERRFIQQSSVESEWEMLARIPSSVIPLRGILLDSHTARQTPLDGRDNPRRTKGIKRRFKYGGPELRAVPSELLQEDNITRLTLGSLRGVCQDWVVTRRRVRHTFL